MISFDRKTVYNIYFFFNKGWFNIFINEYIYINNQIVICLLAIIKKADFFKTQAASHAWSKFKKKEYLRQTKSISDFYRNSLKNIMDSNIDNEVSNKNNFL